MKIKYRLPAGRLYAPYLLDMINGNHVLIAGTTGAGKSVLENAIIYSLLCSHYPGDTTAGKSAQFVLIDPKKVELQCYKKLPHTILYADTLDSIVAALYQVRAIIDKRISYMQKHGQRKSTETPIYIFIDELLDLMVSKKAAEIIRLLSDSASISRATNIYFIALTQSPSRKIIPAAFKLLFNCRVALRCNNAIESRQIIDDDTAVNLPRHGIGIVQQNLDRYKIKIPFYFDSEINDIVKFWTRQHPLLNHLLRP